MTASPALLMLRTGIAALEHARDLRVKVGVSELQADALLQHIAALEQRVEAARQFIADAKRGHDTCEDSWYSCPLSTEGCADDRETDCNCGANNWNAKVDSFLSQLTLALPTEQK